MCQPTLPSGPVVDSPSGHHAVRSVKYGNLRRAQLGTLSRFSASVSGLLPSFFRFKTQTHAGFYPRKLSKFEGQEAELIFRFLAMTRRKHV